MLNQNTQIVNKMSGSDPGSARSAVPPLLVYKTVNTVAKRRMKMSRALCVDSVVDVQFTSGFFLVHSFASLIANHRVSYTADLRHRLNM